ncbi:MAG: aspartate aminotransferase family protein, partial [Fuerstiella sp.]
PVAMAAGLATLQRLERDNPYDLLESLSQQLADGLLQSGAEAGVPVQINRVGSMLTMFFNDNPVTDFESATASDTDRFSRWFHGMLDRGIYLPCSQFEALFVSAAHTPALVEQTLTAARQVMATL